MIRSVSRIFRDSLAMPVFGVYAGREGEQSLERVSPPGRSPFDTLDDTATAFEGPQTLPSSTIPQGARPRITSMSSIVGPQYPVASGLKEQSLESPPLTEAETGPVQTEPQAAAPQSTQTVVVFPWRGPFGWNGIIITGANQESDATTLARIDEPITRIGERLAVALQWKSEQAERSRIEERSMRTTGFAQAVLTALESSAPFASKLKKWRALSAPKAPRSGGWKREGRWWRNGRRYGCALPSFLPLPLGQGLAGTVAHTSSPLRLKMPGGPRCLFPAKLESGIGSYLARPRR